MRAFARCAACVHRNGASKRCNGATPWRALRQPCHRVDSAPPAPRVRGRAIARRVTRGCTCHMPNRRARGARRACLLALVAVMLACLRRRAGRRPRQRPPTPPWTPRSGRSASRSTRSGRRPACAPLRASLALTRGRELDERRHGRQRHLRPHRQPRPRLRPALRRLRLPGRDEGARTSPAARPRRPRRSSSSSARRRTARKMLCARLQGHRDRARLPRRLDVRVVLDDGVRRRRATAASPADPTPRADDAARPAPLYSAPWATCASRATARSTASASAASSSRGRRAALRLGPRAPRRVV